MFMKMFAYVYGVLINNIVSFSAFVTKHCNKLKKYNAAIVNYYNNHINGEYLKIDLGIAALGVIVLEILSIISGVKIFNFFSKNI